MTKFEILARVRAADRQEFEQSLMVLESIWHDLIKIGAPSSSFPDGTERLDSDPLWRWLMDDIGEDDDEAHYCAGSFYEWFTLVRTNSPVLRIV